MPGEGFAPVMPSAERIEVRSAGRAPRNWFMMIKIAALSSHRATRYLTRTISEPQHFTQRHRWIMALIHSSQQITRN